MFNRFSKFPQIPFWASVGEIPTSYKVAMSYEEQLLWLCHQIDMIKSASGNYNYEVLENKPKINGYELLGNLSLNALGIQEKLQAGANIVINGNVISATGGGGGGGTDNYEALDNKPQINGVTLIGNKTFQDLGLNFPTKTVWHEPSDYSGVDIDTNLLFDLTNTSIGDEIPNWEVASNTKVYCMKWDSLPSHNFKVSGRCSNVMWAIVNGYPYFSIGNKTLIDKSEANLQYSDDIITLTEFSLTDTSDYYVLFQFTDTAFDTPSLKVSAQEIDFGTDYNELDNKPTINGVQLVGNKTSGDLHIGSNAKYLETNVFLIDGTTLSLDTGFYYTDTYQVYRTNTSEVVVGQYQLFYFDKTKQYLWTPNKFYIYYEELGGWASSNNTFVENSLSNSQDKIPSSYAVYNALLSGVKAQILGSNVVLNSDGTTTPELQSGLYISGVYEVGVSGQTPLIKQYQLFYYNKYSDLWFSDNTFYTGAFQYTYDTGTSSWIIVRNDFLENTLSDSTDLIPTSHAVYQAIQNISPSGSSFYTELDYSLHLQSDGTIIDDNGFSVTLTTGYYKFINDNKLAIDPVNYDATKNSIFFYNATGNAFEFFTNTSTNYKWAYIGFEYSSGSWKDYTDRFVTTISSSGDDDDIPTNKAVRDYVGQNQANYSTTEKVVGTWTNGKPLYEKVIIEEAPNVTTDGTIATKTSDLGVANAIDFAFVKNSFVKLNGSVWTCPYIAGSGRSVKTQITTTGSGITRLQMSSDGIVYNGSTFYSVVNYTKTAD